ncbi:MAG TPA: alpha/beta hydrolase [Xanthobacteraceae bacterium]|jgi:lysophospholipase
MILQAIPANPVPEGAVTGHITANDGVKIRYARWNPTAPRRGTVCVLMGRADMIEKYFEVVEELRGRGFAVTVHDWRGQGGSDRKLRDPRKGYVRSFDEYQLDLEALIREVVLPDCPPPLFALAHSMGGLILLEAVKQGRRWFDRAVITAPMLHFARMRGGPIVPFVVKLGQAVGLGRLYVPGGGPVPVVHGPFLGNRATSDPVRYERAASTVQSAPHLALGSPTIAWANAAFSVMRRAEDPSYAADLRQPLLILAAGKDNVVSNAAIERFATRLRAGAHLVVSGSRHEILMERDVFRSQFWAAFDAFIPGSPPRIGTPGYR